MSGIPPGSKANESTGRAIGHEFAGVACRRAVLNPPPAPLSVITDWERPDDPDWVDEHGGELTGICPKGASRLLAFAGESLATAKLIL